MDHGRRAFLRAAAAAGLTGLAGCSSLGYRGSDGDGRTDVRDGGSGATTREPLPGETALPVPRSALRRAAERDGIPAITDPAFGPDWAGISYGRSDGETYTPRLSGDDLVVGITDAAGERARAYPLSLLRWHEAVNDRYEPRPGAGGTDGEAVGGPLLVTGSEVINDGVGGVPVVVAATRTGTFAYDRRVGGRTLRFEAPATEAGDVLVADGSRWAIPTGRALDGPHAGTRLRAVPEASELYWFAWASFHPGTRVWRP